MKAVLTSTNEAKVTATKNILSRFFSDLEVEAVDVDSGVAETPTSENEGIKGCLHRIEEGKKKISDADLYIGLEGIITTNDFGTFLSGWCGIEQPKKNRTAFGSSAKVKIPEFIVEKIEESKRLSDIVRNTYPPRLVDELPKVGTNGIITENMYTRVDEFEDALLTTIGYLQNESNFTESSRD